MSRKPERVIFFLSSMWSIIQGIFTLIYSYQIKKGTVQISSLDILKTEYMKSALSQFTVTYAFILFIIAIVNIFLIRKIKDRSVQKKTTIWIGLLLFISFITADIINILLYVSLIILLASKNKAIVLSKNKTIKA